MARASNKSGQTDDPIVIKKYANRRLYNTRTSAYIVLADVIDLINAGTEFVIEDAKTGENITRTILNQIIFEQETQPTTFLLSLEFQKQLIRLYNDAYGKMVPDFLTQSMNYFTSEKGAWQKNFTEMMSKNTESMMKQSEELARKNYEMFRKTWDIFGVMEAAETPTDAGDGPDGKTSKDEGERDSELDDLQAQIDALQSKLKSLK